MISSIDLNTRLSIKIEDEYKQEETRELIDKLGLDLSICR